MPSDQMPYEAPPVEKTFLNENKRDNIALFVKVHESQHSVRGAVSLVA
jgi:hypothetical protein